jgi:hypothetical protein
MTDADLLRDVLPRLHKAGIAEDLRCVCTSYIQVLDRYVYKWTLRIETEDVEIDEDTARTHTIGAMVEAMHGAEKVSLVGFFAGMGSPLQQLIETAVNCALIDPPTTTEEQ